MVFNPKNLHGFLILVTYVSYLVGSTECKKCFETRGAQSAAELNCEDLCSSDKLLNVTSSDGKSEINFCRPEECYCTLASSGESEEIELYNNSARCFAFDVLDRHHYLQVAISPAGNPNMKVHTYLNTGIGPENPPRFQLGADTNFPTYSIDQDSTFSLSRSSWRSNASKDEGEWEGKWSICINASSGTGDGDIVRVGLKIDASRCPLGHEGRVCSNQGECVRKMGSECNQNVIPQCFEYYCACNDGFQGVDCMHRVEGNSTGAESGSATSQDRKEEADESDGDGGEGGEDAENENPDTKYEKPKYREHSHTNVHKYPHKRISKRGYKVEKSRVSERTSSVLFTVVGLGIVALFVFVIKKQMQSKEIAFTLLDSPGKQKKSKRKGKFIELL